MIVFDIYVSIPRERIMNRQTNKKVISLIIVYQKKISSIINKEIIKGMGKQLKLVDDN